MPDLTNAADRLELAKILGALWFAASTLIRTAAAGLPDRQIIALHRAKAEEIITEVDSMLR